MAKNNRVSSKTHTQAQLNNRANQLNPNNRAYASSRQYQNNMKYGDLGTDVNHIVYGWGTKKR